MICFLSFISSRVVGQSLCVSPLIICRHCCLWSTCVSDLHLRSFVAFSFTSFLSASFQHCFIVCLHSFRFPIFSSCFTISALEVSSVDRTSPWTSFSSWFSEFFSSDVFFNLLQQLMTASLQRLLSFCSDVSPTRSFHALPIIITHCFILFCCCSSLTDWSEFSIHSCFALFCQIRVIMPDQQGKGAIWWLSGIQRAASVYKQSSQSSHHPQEVLLAQFSLYVHKGGLKPDSFTNKYISCLMQKSYIHFIFQSNYWIKQSQNYFTFSNLLQDFFDEPMCIV